MKPLCPPGWPRPKGYSNAMAAHGRFILTAGVVGWNVEEKFEETTLAGQHKVYYREESDTLIGLK